MGRRLTSKRCLHLFSSLELQLCLTLYVLLLRHNFQTLFSWSVKITPSKLSPIFTFPSKRLSFGSMLKLTFLLGKTFAEEMHFYTFSSLFSKFLKKWRRLLAFFASFSNTLHQRILIALVGATLKNLAYKTLLASTSFFV